jgi:hypothetical protein
MGEASNRSLGMLQQKQNNPQVQKLISSLLPYQQLLPYINLILKKHHLKLQTII